MSKLPPGLFVSRVEDLETVGDMTAEPNNRDSPFVNTVERIVQRVASLDASSPSAKTNSGGFTEASTAEEEEGNAARPGRQQQQQGPLTRQELAELSLLCTMAATCMSSTENSTVPRPAAAAAALAPNHHSRPEGDDFPSNGFALVEGDTLLTLLDLLDRHVHMASGVRLITEAWQFLQSDPADDAPADHHYHKKKDRSSEKWLATGGAGFGRARALKLGLEAAAIVIFIAASPSIDRRAISEDAIEASLTLMRLHFSKNLLPALNPHQHLSPTTAAAAQPDDKMTSPSKKRRRTDEGPTALAHQTKELKAVYQEIASTINLQLILVERFEQLIKNVPLDDQQILLLTSGVLPALELDPLGLPLPKGLATVQQFQTACINVVIAAFAKYPSHRETILEDLFPIMLKLPTGKRSLRTATLRYTAAVSPQNLAGLIHSTVTKVLWPKDTVSAADQLHQPQHIQMMTLLLLSLVQSSVIRPSYMEERRQDDAEEGQDSDNPKYDVKLVSGLRGCHAVCESFVVQLLRRCARQKGGGASEFRPILSNLVEDLLMVLLNPDYPAAEMLLSTFVRRLNQDLTLASPTLFKLPESPSSPAPDATYLNTVFDTLGKICAVQAKILAVQRERPLTMAAPLEAPVSDDAEPHLACYCGKSQVISLRLNCDQCKTFFHGSCVGINANNIPESWFCDPCRLGQIAARVRRRHLSDGEAHHIDEIFAIHHAQQSAISQRTHGTEMDYVCKFHLACWIDEVERRTIDGGDAKIRPRHLVAELMELWEKQGPAGEALSDEGSIRSVLYLSAKASTLLLSFRTQMAFLIKLMSDPKAHSLRKLSLKTIEKTVEGDQHLMLLPIITKAVSRRLTDDSISVREAALSLVGTHVVKSPAVANSYHSSLLLCLTDVGVSVRKRAIRIFQEVLANNPRYKGRSAVCDAMLQRAADPKEEDSVRDLIESLFNNLWLLDGEQIVASPVPVPNRSQPEGNGTLSPITQHEETDSGPGVVTPTTPSGSRKKKEDQRGKCRADLAVEQMMEVVRIGGTGEHLEKLVKKLLSDVPDTDKDRRKGFRINRASAGDTQCVRLVKSLYELLLTIEEQRSSRSTRMGKDLAATLQTIAVFADFCPRAVASQLDIVLPYLKADNGVSTEDETAIVAATCDIIFRLVSSQDISQLREKLSISVANDLVQVTYKFGTVALGSAIKTFCALAGGSESSPGSSTFATKLIELARTFYGYLHRKQSIQDFSGVDEKTRNNVNRALAILGLICQHSKDLHVDSLDAESNIDATSSLMDPKDLSSATLTLACYQVFSRYLTKHDSQTKCSAIHGLSGIFASQPRLMLQLEQNGLIAEVMSDQASLALQMEALQCWKNILQAEEKRIDGGLAQTQMDADGTITLSKRIAGDQDGDATLFGGVLTNHADRLFQMSHSPETELRLAALELLAILLRQGLVNPNDAVPHLFALQGDIENETIRSLALQLLITEGEKRPDMLRQRICAGVREAYKLQRIISPERTQPSAVVAVKRGETAEFECIFSSVFKECISSNKKQRQGLFKNLLSLFVDEDASRQPSPSRRSRRSSFETATMDLSLLVFASQILAHLPYATSADPLFIIHQIGSVVTLHGTQTLDSFATFLRPLGLASRDEYDDSNYKEDALELAAKTKLPSRAAEARALSSADQGQFLHLCRDGAALALLLRLKSFLRRLYNLSESRCAEYNPNSKETNADKSLSKLELSKPFDASIPKALFQDHAVKVDTDALIRQYAEFRRLMREEAGSELSTLDEDEPSPSKKRRTLE